MNGTRLKLEKLCYAKRLKIIERIIHKSERGSPSGETRIRSWELRSTGEGDGGKLAESLPARFVAFTRNFVFKHERGSRSSNEIR